MLKRPHRNKVCCVSILQGKVAVPGKMYARNKRERKREWVCESERQCSGCDFTSRLTFVSALCVLWLFC